MNNYLIRLYDDTQIKANSNFIKSYIYSLVAMNYETAIKIAFIRKDEIKKDE